MTCLPTILASEASQSGVLAVLFGMPGWAEILIVAFVGLLIFGRRLPEVGRSLGKSIVEFKKGVREAKDQIDVASTIDAEPTKSLPPSQPSPPRSEPTEQPKAKTGEDAFSEYR